MYTRAPTGAGSALAESDVLGASGAAAEPGAAERGGAFDAALLGALSFVAALLDDEASLGF
jgi:hypothetical protein